MIDDLIRIFGCKEIFYRTTASFQNLYSLKTALAQCLIFNVCVILEHLQQTVLFGLVYEYF